MRGTKETGTTALWSIQICSALLLTIAACQIAFGQVVVGRISGTVQDADAVCMAEFRCISCMKLVM